MDYDPNQHFILVGGGSNGDNDQDQGDFDYYYDNDYDDGYTDADGRHDGVHTDTPDGHHNYVLQDLPDMDVQSALDCWLEAAEFLYKFFDNQYDNAEIDQFNNQCMQFVQNELNLQQLHETLLHGLPSGQPTEHFVNEFFENQKLSDVNGLIDALSQGHPVFAGVDSIHDDPNNNNYNHQVVIVGYEYDANNNFVFICADSATGQIEYYPYDHINFNDLYAILGLK
ncbi:hypothetical protein [Chryseobacterium wanjuense]